ncbi:MAG TPA: HEPN domain-containing protein [Beijerinckiaceae bacterium]|nr:HEPN domain-containing protein [Beijerinckiaceae bacterium]
MTPEAKNYLDKARSDLDEARKIAAIGLATVAARSAYYAAFHAAEAFISEQTGKTVKTHSGVRAEFSRLTKATPNIDRKFITFLAQAYMYKEIADYNVEPGAAVTMAEAEDAIAIATQFLDRIATILAASP